MRFTITRLLLNFIGATTRWVFGMIWRSVLNKPKFTFDEYLSGPKNSVEYFDVNGHKLNNRIIGFIVLVILIRLIIKYT